MDELISEWEKLGLRIEPNPERAFLLDIYTSDGEKLSQEQFERRYADLIARTERASPKSGEQPKLLAEGDSWIRILWPASGAFGFEKNFMDKIADQHRFNILNVGWPGDTLENLIDTKTKQIQHPISSGLYPFFIFSGAGNDLLGGGALKRFLKKRSAVDFDQPVSTWLNQSELAKAYAFISTSYEQLAREIKVWGRGKTRMYIHGYDYALPRVDGTWLGKPMQDLGYDVVGDEKQVRAIVRHLINRLYDELGQIASAHSHVTLLDLRGIVGNRWTDELHTEVEASDEIAALFVEQMSVTS